MSRLEALYPPPLDPAEVERRFAAERHRVRLWQVREAKALLREGFIHRAEIAKKVGISRVTLRAIEDGRYWYV